RNPRAKLGWSSSTRRLRQRSARRLTARSAIPCRNSIRRQAAPLTRGQAEMALMRYAEALNLALREEMRRDPTVFLFGEDIGRYGGVFKVTRGLIEQFGELRVRDTPISEQAMAAMAVTAAMTGTRPVLEIMYADFLPLALDALVNQASIYEYIWNGQVRMPFVLRTQGGGGAGAGAQHSKSLDALVAHVPGLQVVSPATPADARGLRT